MLGIVRAVTGVTFDAFVRDNTRTSFLGWQ